MPNVGEVTLFRREWLRLPSLLLVFLTTLVLVTTLPAATGDTTADRVLGQIVFTLNGQNFIDGAGFNFTVGSIGNVTPANGVAVDVSSTPQHLYIADTLNSRILGWNNAESFANGQAADLVIGQIDMLHNRCDQPTNDFNAATATNLCFPTGVAVDSNGDLYIADFENNRVVEYNAPYAAYAAIPHTCTAANPCQNQLTANLVFGQVDALNNPTFTTSNCNGPHGQGAVTSNVELCTPEGVSVNPTTHDLYVADATNNRVVVYLDPLTGGGMQRASGHPGDETADYVFGQGGVFTTTTCNKGGSVDREHSVRVRSFSSAAAESEWMQDGNVYIADTINNRVLQFNTRSPGVRPSPPRLPPMAFSARPTSPTAAPTWGARTKANIVGRADRCQSSTAAATFMSRISTTAACLSSTRRLLRASTRRLISVFGQNNFTSNFCFNPSATSLCDPSGVAIDSLGNVFIADLNNNRVIEYNAPLSADSNTADRGAGSGTCSTWAFTTSSTARVSISRRT